MSQMKFQNNYFSVAFSVAEKLDRLHKLRSELHSMGQE